MNKSQVKPASAGRSKAISGNGSASAVPNASLPTHIGIIADGNRRWAKANGLPSFEGHRQGEKRIEELAEYAFSRHIQYLSFYVFSTENWNRTKKEVSFLMSLFRIRIPKLLEKCNKHKIRIIIMGRDQNVPKSVLKILKNAEEATKNYQNGSLIICFNYGGQWEIADAATKIVTDINSGKLPKDTEFTPELFEKYIYHPEVPPCDIIVRTSGEERISGFQLWRSNYAEFFFEKKNFPDFKPDDLAKVIREFSQRKRNFGK